MAFHVSVCGNISRHVFEEGLAESGQCRFGLWSQLLGNHESQISEMEVRTMKSVKTIVGLSIVVLMAAASPFAFAQATHVRWDIITVNFVALTVDAGGVASVAGRGPHTLREGL